MAEPVRMHRWLVARSDGMVVGAAVDREQAITVARVCGGDVYRVDKWTRVWSAQQTGAERKERR